MRIKNLIARMYRSAERSVQYSEPRFFFVGAVGVAGFPLYYVIWKYLFPQPYENLALRLFGALIFLPLMMAGHWPKRLRDFLPVYWYVAILYALPFFFTFMLLKNDGTTTWAMSTLLALCLMILLLDWVNLIAQVILGAGLAWLAYYVTTDLSLQVTYLEYLPTYLFAVITGIVLNFNSEAVRQERMRAMLATASNIAHELRTPLLGMKSGAVGLRQYLPSLLHAYELAAQHGLPITPIRKTHIESMKGVLDRIAAEADRSNVMIDMLLMNARSPDARPSDFTFHSMAHCVDIALTRYPLSAEQDRLVTCDTERDFRFLGSEILMVHVLFNLLKNALFHVARAKRGSILIQLDPTPTGNRLIFRDAGPGIPHEVQRHIFERFYSWSSSEKHELGAGIGLAFCKDIIHSFGGTIVCSSEPGQFTEFLITLPVQDH